MKRFIIAVLLVLFFADSFCQKPANPMFSKDYFRQRSKNQNTAAWILLAGGTAMVVGGAIGFNENFVVWGGTDAQNRRGDTYGFILLGGIISDLVSIPFFLSAAHNRRIAASLSLINNQISVRQQNALALKSIPNLSLKIRF